MDVRGGRQEVGATVEESRPLRFMGHDHMVRLILCKNPEHGKHFLLRDWDGEPQIYIESNPARLYYGSAPGPLSLPAELVDAFFVSLEETLNRHSPAGQRLDYSHEQEMAQYCGVLAFFDQIVRAGVFPTSPLFAKGCRSAVGDSLSIAEDDWIEELCSLSCLFYDRCRHLLSGDAILNPTFIGSSDVGGADSDFIIDGCLIDVKTAIKLGDWRNWLYQLIGYTLLDYDDRYGISEGGIYFTRQGILLRWKLHDLMFRLSGVAVTPLDELRQDFREVAFKS